MFLTTEQLIRKTTAELTRKTRGATLAEIRAHVKFSLGLERYAPGQPRLLEEVFALVRTRMQAAPCKPISHFERLMVLVKRLDVKIAKEVVAAANRCDYRVSKSGWAGGEHCTSVGVARNSWAPSLRRTSFRKASTSCSGGSTRVWSHNGKWSGQNSEFHFLVPSDWTQTVQAAGLAVVDGRLTLEAYPVTGNLLPGEQAWVASWAVQSTGFNLRKEDGFLVRYKGQVAHGHTISAASRQLKLRARQAEHVAREQEAVAQV